MTCFSLTVLFFEKKSRQKKLQLSGTIYRFFRLPCVKGAVGASRLRDCFLQPSNRCAVSEPVSATPASVLRTLANPFHHFVVPLPLHRGGTFKPVSARPASVLRTLANPSNRFAVSEPLSAKPAPAHTNNNPSHIGNKHTKGKNL